MGYQNVGIFCSPSHTGAQSTALIITLVLAVKILNCNSITKVTRILQFACVLCRF